MFDGFKALDIDTFTVREREVRVVIGPNGAGKTTLCDVISGKTRLTSGRCFFDGTDISQMKDYEIARRGVGRKFQTPAVFGSLTVRENLGLAARKTTPRANPHTGFSGIGRKRPRAGRQRRASWWALPHSSTKRRNTSATASASRSKSACCSSLGPKLLLIDEPAAGLSDEETAAMARLLIEACRTAHRHRHRARHGFRPRAGRRCDHGAQRGPRSSPRARCRSFRPIRGSSKLYLGR